MSPRRTDGSKKPGRLRGAENRARALELRIAGASTLTIADELGVSRQHAWRLIDTAARGLAAEIADKASEWRAIQAARIEEDIAHLRAETRGGDLSAYRTVVRLYERQARLLNLDLRPAGAPGLEFTVISTPPWERPAEVEPSIEGEVVEALRLPSGQADDA